MNENIRIVLTDVVSDALSLAIQVYLLQGRPSSFDRSDFDLGSAVLGAIETACYRYVAEHEPVASRLEDWSGELVFTIVVFGSVRRVSRFVPSRNSRSIGGGTGALVYRIVFGVAFDLPEGRSRRWSSSLFSRVRSRLVSAARGTFDRARRTL